MSDDGVIRFMPARDRINVLKRQHARDATAYALDIEGYAELRIISELRECGDNESDIGEYQKLLEQ